MFFILIMITSLMGIFLLKNKNEQLMYTLLKEFDRIVLCCGASNPRDIKVPGREAEGSISQQIS